MRSSCRSLAQFHRLQKPWSEEEGQHGSGRTLAGQVLYLTVAGMWPRGRGTPYLLYVALVQLCAVSYVAVGLVSIHTARGDVNSISYTLLHTLEVFSGMVKAGLFFSKRRSFYRLVRDLDLMASDYLDRPELESARRWARRMTVSLSAYIFVVILLWLPTPLLTGGDQKMLPMVQIHGVDWSQWPQAYAALYALQCAVPLTQVPIVIGLDGFFVAAMLYVGALLQLLGQRVSGLRLAGDGAADLSGDAGLKMRQMLYAELSACINSHQKITKFLRDLESAMSAMVLVQLSSTMLNLCMGLYHQTKIRDVLTAMQYAMILPFYSSQIYFYCWTADAITQQGAGLSLAAYSSCWVGAGTSFQKALSILMARAHKPLVITAGRLYPINTAAFVALMKASYSYYTLLRQLDSN
ncbi:odorant receptor Or2-like [Schistocerca serialis cubense]|uniref:odorant receptor Or2-like n=1 Tax=Schistocerca serialis cubense TaxID=2023355 RepID=UPI00214E5C27|nr:odorant receptor Or2-like [Schistocerca serialis cubense]